MVLSNSLSLPPGFEFKDHLGSSIRDRYNQGHHAASMIEENVEYNQANQSASMIEENVDGEESKETVLSH